MIPSALTAVHVLQALRRIDRDGVPRGRHSRGYDLVHEDRRYPPKYTVALAVELATGAFPSSDTFGGGAETNGLLERLGFVVVAKGAPLDDARLLKEDTLHVGRVFLDLGVRQRAYRSMLEGKAAAFGVLSDRAFSVDPGAYVARIVRLVRRAHEEGASVVVLPACALQVSEDVGLEEYAVPEVPFVVAGGANAAGEFGVVLRDGIEVHRFDASRVHWLGLEQLSLMVAISSTIGQAVESRFRAPVRSTTLPPDPSTPVLIADVGHAQYGSRYDFNTLRCVARDVGARVGQPAALVLSSWMWSSRGIGTGWCHPRDRFDVRRLEGTGDDHVDVLTVSLSASFVDQR